MSEVVRGSFGSLLLRKEGASGVGIVTPQASETSWEQDVVTEQEPFKAVPLVNSWHPDFEATLEKCYQEAAVIQQMEFTQATTQSGKHGVLLTNWPTPYLLSPRVPTARVLQQDKEGVKVMMYHGLTYANVQSSRRCREDHGEAFRSPEKGNAGTHVEVATLD